MIAIPAIDLRGGACVQLVGGSFADEKVRIADPLTALAQWEEAGFRRLHVVDLDAATDRGDNRTAIDALLGDATSVLQIGGGVRTTEHLDDLLSRGAQYVVVGTRAIEDVDWLRDVTSRYPGRVIVAADVRERRVSVRGWKKTLDLNILDAIDTLNDFDIAGVLVTAVHVEGQMKGPDLGLIGDVVERAECHVIASGGISNADDLRALQSLGVHGAVIGMALYTGALDPRATAAEFSE
ncbi:MAG: 1-(5-phosphoribosyl)-5-[(5-phosphoribosylamino)methylideneamino] imidazole-4-carboxamide isomerase [Gemmatimonadaceae bacterium]